MPRRKPRRDANRRGNIQATVITMQAIIDSDEDSASLSSSVCGDYYSNLVEAGFGMVQFEPAESLDLTKGLPSPPLSPHPEKKVPIIVDEMDMYEGVGHFEANIDEGSSDEHFVTQQRAVVVMQGERPGTGIAVVANEEIAPAPQVIDTNYMEISEGDRGRGNVPSDVMPAMKQVPSVKGRTFKADAKSHLKREAKKVTPNPAVSEEIHKNKVRDNVREEPFRPEPAVMPSETVFRVFPSQSKKGSTKDPTMAGKSLSKPYSSESSEPSEPLSSRTYSAARGSSSTLTSMSLSPSNSSPSAPQTFALLSSKVSRIETLPPPPEHCTSEQDRKVWDLVQQQTLAAFRFFNEYPFRGTTFECEPMALPKARLAMHRAGEMLGCRSRSNDEGRHRRVLLTWTKNGTFPISEVAILAAVRCVLNELYPPPMFVGNAASRTNCKNVRREERKAKKREQKIEEEALAADMDVDPEVVEALVLRQDWYTLDKLYQGVRVPAIELQKKKALKQAKAAARKEVQQTGQAQKTQDCLMASRGSASDSGPYDGISRYGKIVGHRQTYPFVFPPSRVIMTPGYQGYANQEYANQAYAPQAYVPYVGGAYGVYPAAAYSMHGKQQQSQWPMRSNERSDAASSSKKERKVGAHAAFNAKPLEKTNKGFEMLEKMGWKQGDGLGTTREGRREPVKAEIRKGRGGLGK